jgi:hypothetical protein
MSAVDVVDFVVEYFGSDPSRRSLNPHYTGQEHETRCLYRGPEGRRCAFAIFVAEDEVEALREGRQASDNLHGSGRLRPEVEHLARKTEFWDRLQCLHDTKSYWNAEGFTDHGKLECEMLRAYAASTFCQVDETTKQDAIH